VRLQNREVGYQRMVKSWGVKDTLFIRNLWDNRNIKSFIGFRNPQDKPGGFLGIRNILDSRLRGNDREHRRRCVIGEKEGGLEIRDGRL